MANQTAETIHLEEELRELRSILRVAQAVVSSLEFDEVLENILASAMAVMEVPAGAIALYDAERSELEFHARAGLSPRFLAEGRRPVRPGSLTRRVLDAGELAVVEDTRQTPYAIHPAVLAEGVRALIAVPLRIQNEVLGILYLDDFVPRSFSGLRLQALAILASFAALSIGNARLHEQTRQLACTDGLTGLFNHRHFLQIFREELVRAARYRKPLSLAMFDIDDFKLFNDTYGHPNGDRALAHVAGILQHSLREYDILFRYGGEEFIAILPETGIGEALAAAERARLAIEQYTPAALGPMAVHGLTVSAGIASFPRDGEDLDTLLKTTDDLLYQAKKQGKNRVYHLPEKS
jgi:diguanylate cyclase (GGDEF)-like protein